MKPMRTYNGTRSGQSLLHNVPGQNLSSWGSAQAHMNSGHATKTQAIKSFLPQNRLEGYRY